MAQKADYGLSSALGPSSAKWGKKIIVRVPDSIHKEIKLLAAHLNITITQIVMNSLAHYTHIKEIKCISECCLK